MLTACAAKRRVALLLRALAAWRGERCASRALAEAAASRTRDAMLRQALQHWHAAAARARQGRRLAALRQQQVQEQTPQIYLWLSRSILQAALWLQCFNRSH